MSLRRVESFIAKFSGYCIRAVSACLISPWRPSFALLPLSQP